MPKKKFTEGQDHGYIGDKPYAPPKKKPYIPHPFEVQYIRDRDDSWLNDMFTPEYLKELILERRK